MELDAHLILLSETSATLAVQNKEVFEFKSKGYHTIWGHPMPPQMHGGPRDSMRGAAAGVSLHTRYMPPLTYP